MIGFPAELPGDVGHPWKDSQDRSTSLQAVRYEEWGYAERQWYLEGQQGITGVLRALFWPSEGVVEIAQYDQLWADRTPQPPSDLFKFELSEEGYKRLRAHLQSTKESSEPVKAFAQSSFYAAADSYYVFHHCHQYVARALSQAGLPISSLLAISKAGLSFQLEHLEELEKHRNENRAQ